MHHDLDIGLALNKSFAFSSRTSVGFTSGSTVISIEGQRHFELTGSAQLRRLLSRRWSSSLEYQRGLTAIDTQPRPFVANTINGDIGGFIGSRVKVSVQPRYSWGADIADASRTFHSVIGTTRVDTAVSRNWAMFAEFFYYDYRFAGGARSTGDADVRNDTAGPALGPRPLEAASLVRGQHNAAGP